MTGGIFRTPDCTSLVVAAGEALELYRIARQIPGFPTARLHRDYLATRAAAERCLGKALPRERFPDREVAYEAPERPDARRLHGKVLAVLRRLPPDRRVAVYQRWVDQMHRRAGWDASRGRLADGGVSFAGTAGDALVFDPAGVMWRGNVTLPGQFSYTPAGLRANYPALRRVG
jgi:hypothetical protein